MPESYCFYLIIGFSILVHWLTKRDRPFKITIGQQAKLAVEYVLPGNSEFRKNWHTEANRFFDKVYERVESIPPRKLDFELRTPTSSVCVRLELVDTYHSGLRWYVYERDLYRYRYEEIHNVTITSDEDFNKAFNEAELYFQKEIIDQQE